jgi:hypothetical protein
MLQKKSGSKDNNQYAIILLAVSIISIVLLALYIYKTGITGYAILKMPKDTFYAYEVLSGSLNLSLNANEYIPSTTIIKVEVD